MRYKGIVNKPNRVKGTRFNYSINIPFADKTEYARFSQFCEDRAHTQGGFTRLAILEKLSREESKVSECKEAVGK